MDSLLTLCSLFLYSCIESRTEAYHWKQEGRSEGLCWTPSMHAGLARTRSCFTTTTDICKANKLQTQAGLQTPVSERAKHRFSSDQVDETRNSFRKDCDPILVRTTPLRCSRNVAQNAVPVLELPRELGGSCWLRAPGC